MLGISVDAGSSLANILEFTTDKFYGWIEIIADQKTDQEIIYLQYIYSKEKRKGNVKRLLKYWLDSGFRVRIVRPVQEMRELIETIGFVPYEEIKEGTVPIGIPAEIWRIPSDMD